MILEKGTGTESFQSVFGKNTSDEDFREKRQTYLKNDDVYFIDKE